MKRVVFYICIYILSVDSKDIAEDIALMHNMRAAGDVIKLIPIEYVGELTVTKSIPDIPFTVQGISNSGEIIKGGIIFPRLFRSIWNVKTQSGVMFSRNGNDGVTIRDTEEENIVSGEKNTLKVLTLSSDFDLQVRTNHLTLLHSSNSSGNFTTQPDKDTCCNIFDNNVSNIHVNFLDSGNKLSANVANGGMLVTGFRSAFKTTLFLNSVPTTGNTYGSKILYYNGATISDYVSYDLDKAESIVANPKFNMNRTSVLFIHGYNQSPVKPPSQTLINAYISNGNYNIMMLDWGMVASGNVVAVMTRLEPLGIEVALFLDRLNKKGVSFSKVHLVGHSFGAHIAAIAGKYTIQWSGNTNKIDRISGLDPANFYSYDVMYNYARFVDIIHTAAGGLGNTANLGHVDFWPNNGVARQPGSPKFPITLEQLVCSHLRAIYFWSESVQRKDRISFLAVNKANPQIIIQMGNNCPTYFVKGQYTLTTNSESSFSKN